MNAGVGVAGETHVGNDEIGASIGGSVGIFVGVDGHATANEDGLSVAAEYHEVAEATATASGSVEKEGVGVGGSVTVYAKTGTDVEGHLDAGKGGVAVGAEASIGEAAGIEAELTGKERYVGGTVGAGVSVGEHFEAGGSAEATYNHGVVTVGVAGDLAAIVGLDVDVSVSVDTKQIVQDGKAVTNTVAKEVEKVAPVVINTAVSAVNQVADTTKTATKAVENTAKSVTNTVSKGAKKFFKKLKI